ncbi:MAG: hypothetical protein FJZ10_04050 [Candidatus Omnitrophica bacterium]|nr:hypothetical protein [Candidatus Omnitrophota bacterium]
MTGKIVIVFFVLSVFAATTFAEVIYLKSGKKHEGKIVERTDEYIKIDMGIGMPLTFFLDEIEKIEGNTISDNNIALSPSASASEGELYIDEDYGFEIKGPKGWFKKLVYPDKIHTQRKSVRYNKYAQAEGETAFPTFVATTDIVPANISNAVDFSNLIIQEWIEILAENKSGILRVIEEPHEIEVNGIKGARAIFEMIATDGKGMRTLDYKFINNNTVFSVMGTDWPDKFETNRQDFEKAVSSFRFISK